MIPTKVDDATQAQFVTNIKDTFARATPDQLARGRAWYKTAQQVAAVMADGNVRAGAGVIAALSPQKAWAYNVKLARNAFATGEARGHVGNAVGKAQSIMLGANPLDVLPEDSKTWNFYRCIVDPDDRDPVVIDRHAHDVAVGETFGNADRGINKTRYAILAHAYREAARQLDEIPSVVQAVTWIVQVDATADLPYRAARRYAEGS
jgi:hypothetical protein